MRRGRITYFILFVLAASLVFQAPLFRSPSKALAGILDEKFDELGQIQKEIDDFKNQISSKKNTENSVTAEIEKLELQLALSQRELDYMVAKIEYLAERIAETEGEIAETEEKTEAKKDLFGDRLVCMYKAGAVSYLEILLNSDSVSDFMARLYYLREIAKDDARLIEEYKVLQQELAEKKELLEKDANDLRWAKSQEEEKRATVASRSADRERYLSEVQNDREKLEQILQQMVRESQALEQVIRDLQAEGHQREKKEGFAMIRPADGGWVSSEFGYRWHPVYGGYRGHTGIDLALDTGKPIKAAEDGTVILSGSNGGYGLCVIVDHGGGISTLYGHASKLVVSKGDVVSQGQTLALVGSTGISTGPHLHFEVRINGTPEDPRNWVKF